MNNLKPLLFSSITREGATPGRLEELVQEDSALGKRRLRLEKRRTDLLKIKQKLDTLWLLSNVPYPTRNHSRVPGSNATARRGSSVGTDDDRSSILVSID